MILLIKVKKRLTNKFINNFFLKHKKTFIFKNILLILFFKK